MSLFLSLSERDTSSPKRRLEGMSDSTWEMTPWKRRPSPCPSLVSVPWNPWKQRLWVTTGPFLTIVFPPASKCLAHSRCLIIIDRINNYWLKERMKERMLSWSGFGSLACLTGREVLSHSVMSDSFCHPLDCSPPGSSVCGISQARILEWVTISFSRGSSWARNWTCVSCIVRQVFYLLSHWGSHGNGTYCHWVGELSCLSSKNSSALSILLSQEAHQTTCKQNVSWQMPTYQIPMDQISTVLEAGNVQRANN